MLLDTEGLYDVKKGDANHDTQLFTLALLLSSLFIFNAMGTLDSTIVNELQYPLHMLI